MRLSLQYLLLSPFDDLLVGAAELVVAQAVASKGRVHNHQVHRRGWFRHSLFAFHLLGDGGPRSEPCLAGEEVQGAQVGLAV